MTARCPNAGRTILGRILAAVLLAALCTLAPGSGAAEEAVAFVREQMATEEGLGCKFTFSGSVYFERMKEIGLYTIDRESVRHGYSVTPDRSIEDYVHSGDRSHGIFNPDISFLDDECETRIFIVIGNITVNIQIPLLDNHGRYTRKLDRSCYIHIPLLEDANRFGIREFLGFRDDITDRLNIYIIRTCRLRNRRGFLK